MESLKRNVIENRNTLGRCPICNSNIKDRTILIYKELLTSLYKIYCWCGEKNIHEFDMKDVKHLLSKNDYARFGDLIRFGGIVYRPESLKTKGMYGINMERARNFYSGSYRIPIQITLNQITNEVIDSHYITVNEVPSLKEFITEKGLYDYEKKIWQGRLL